MTNAIALGEPKRKFRIIVQERKSNGNKIEKCRSFMMYDYEGYNIDEIVEILKSD